MAVGLLDAALEGGDVGFHFFPFFGTDFADYTDFFLSEMGSLCCESGYVASYPADPALRIDKSLPRLARL